MIKVEPCSNCLDVIFVVELGGTRIKADPTPLDAMGAVAAITDQRELYRVKQLGKVPATIGSAGPEVLRALNSEPGERPHVVREHRCTLASRPRTPSPVSGAASPPPVAPAARMTPSQGRSTQPSGATTAATLVSDHPRCSTCGLQLGQGEYVAIELGELMVWASHLDRCP